MASVRSSAGDSRTAPTPTAGRGTSCRLPVSIAGSFLLLSLVIGLPSQTITKPESKQVKEFGGEFLLVSVQQTGDESCLVNTPGFSSHFTLEKRALVFEDTKARRSQNQSRFSVVQSSSPERRVFRFTTRERLRGVAVTMTEAVHLPGGKAAACTFTYRGLFK